MKIFQKIKQKKDLSIIGFTIFISPICGFKISNLHGGGGSE